MVLAAAASLCCNLLYALYHGVLGAVGRSVWFAALCAYYIILSVMRFSAVLCGRRGAFRPAEEAAYFVMEMTGVLLVLLSFVLADVVYLSLSRNVAVRYGEITMISIAAYTFCKLTTVIVRTVRQRNDPAPLPAVMGSINCAEAAASILTLQRSMLASFGGMEAAEVRAMNGWAGAACVFIGLLGVRMTAKGIKGKDKL